MLISPQDIAHILASIVELTVLLFIFYRILNFFPLLMISILKKMKNSSIFLETNDLDKPSLISSLGNRLIFGRKDRDADI